GVAWVGRGRAGSASDVPPDAFVAMPVAQAAARLAGLPRERARRLVVSYEPGRGYGHPDHVHALSSTSDAAPMIARDRGRDRDGGRDRDDDGSAPAVLWAGQDAAAPRRARAALSAAWQESRSRGLDPALPGAQASRTGERGAQPHGPAALRPPHPQDP